MVTGFFRLLTNYTITTTSYAINYFYEVLTGASYTTQGTGKYYDKLKVLRCPDRRKFIVYEIY